MDSVLRQAAPDHHQRSGRAWIPWNNARQAWQHPCGTIRKERATFDPRKRYRSYFAADMKPI